MFEAHVLYLLRQYLGEYVRGLSAEALKISVWKGDVVLKDLQLKSEALNALKLPITVKAGFLGSVTLKVPWNRLGKEPVIVLLDRIFILAEPLQDDLLFSDDKKSWLDAKRRQIEEAELAMLDAKDKRSSLKENSPETSSWLGSLIATIVGNLKVSVTNLHIRYEDTVSNPNHPFCSGVTLGKLAAVTIDEKGMETFVTSGALDKLRKSLQLQHFAVYHDSDTDPWVLQKSWEEMTPQEWSEMFEPRIYSVGDGVQLEIADKHQYLLQPVGGIMKYHRCGKRDRRDPEHPFQKASLVLDQVSLKISEAQYRDGLKLLEGVSRYRTRIEFSRLRPLVSLAKNPRAWWLYACQAVLQQQNRMWYRLSWEKVSRYCHLRRRYVQLYSTNLQQGTKIDDSEIQDMDEELSVEVILLWRLLAHAKMESSKVKEAALAREVARKSSWWTFGRGTEKTDVSPESAAAKEVIGGQPVSGHFTKEEWNKLNELLSYQPGQESPLSSGQESPNMLQNALDITIQHSAAAIVNGEGLRVLCGSFQNLQIALDVYPKSMICNVKLQFYGLSAPEGSLIESVSREGREDALVTTFVHNPLEGNLDWKLSLMMSTCHVTVWRLSFDRFLEFLKIGQALSPGVAMETAAVLQSKLEEVTRKAQEQLQLVLKQQKRFSIDLDVDAPKFRFPTLLSNEGGQETQLVLDLGHFKLDTSPDEDPLEDSMNMGSLYSRFRFFGSDISAFFVDGGFHWSKYTCLSWPMHETCGSDSLDGGSQAGDSMCAIFPVLDRCGMNIVLDQTRMQHPDFPSTRITIEVPCLSFYFSPARYLRLLRLFKALESMNNVSQVDSFKVSTWKRADFSGDSRVLNWGGIGSTVAEWQPCWVSLAGSYLYILDSEGAVNYSRCCSVNNKQLLEIPSENIDGSDCVIALCNRGIDLQKAIESPSTIVMQLRNNDTKASWIRYLTLAIYKASTPVALSLPTESSTGESIQDNPSPHADLSKRIDLLISGSLKELEVFLCGKTFASGSLAKEVPILELQASGGQVDYLQRSFDMSLGIKLHALKVKDRLQDSTSAFQYIACSVLPSDKESGTEKLSGCSSSSTINEESELFGDALSDFSVTASELNRVQPNSSLGLSQIDRSPGRKQSSLRLDPAYLLEAGRMTDFEFENSQKEALYFVRVLLFIRQSESPDYDGTDTQMSINMATLDFFCNRPTVIALIQFGTDISTVMDAQNPSVKSKAAELIPADVRSDPSVRTVIKGLLGRGKSRVVFRLRIALASAKIYLNQENGSQLAMLVQDKFQMDLKVYPRSFSILGTLGNLRVCDMLLGPSHHWGWLCDIRDPACGSLVKLEFCSYSKEEEDYQGYDYSLSGKLSAVRIVFLYRFIQEVTAYFLALATPQVQNVITVVDKAGGIERLVRQADMDGALAIKLNVSLDTPIIIMPRNSFSKEFMQLDLGRLEVYNMFEWHGGRSDDPSAIYLDVLSAEMTGINMFVGIDGKLGKAMIQEARGLHIKVYRPLRDLFKRMPEVQVDVQVESLCGIMSDKEYLVIADCAVTNVGEPAKFPPNFRGSPSFVLDDIEFSGVEHSEPEREEADPSNSRPNEQSVPMWTRYWVTVDIKHSELELCTGDRDLSLARLQIQGFWLGYRNTSIDETDLYVTVPKLSITDERAGTKPEMQLMLGSMTDAEIYVSESIAEVQLSPVSDSDAILTMLVMDLRMKADSKAFAIRIQRPRLLVVVDFILSVAQFFVPSLSTLTGQDSSDIEKDPILTCDHIRLTSPYYQQNENVITLCSDRQLIADAYNVDEFIYDGQGGFLVLNFPSYDAYLITHPLIVIGYGKKLRFRNIHIKNGYRINGCIALSSNSSYSVLPEDGVILSNLGENDLKLDANKGVADNISASSVAHVKNGSPKPDPMDLNLVLDIQIVAPEFTFYDSTKWPSRNFSQQERLLRAKFDFNLMLALKGNDRWVKVFLKGLNIESGSGLAVVDPLDVSGEYVCAQDKTNFHATTTNVSIRLSLNVLRLVMRLHAEIASKFQTGVHALSQCTHFDRIWIDHSGNPLQQVAIWRPRAPLGFVILSDCATSGAAPPSQVVIAVSNSYFRVKRPVSFKLLWCSLGNIGNLHETSRSQSPLSNDVENNVCSIWLPIAPPGYVSVGCVAERGTSPPPLSCIHCIREDLVTSASMTDCIFYVPPEERDYKNGCSIWRIENTVGSFFAHFSTDLPSKHHLCDIREVLLQTLNVAGNDDKAYPEMDSFSKHLRSGSSFTRPERSGSSISKSGRYIARTAQFERLWRHKGSESRQAISVWRPVPPIGYSLLGDVLVEGLEPPGIAIVLHDDGLGKLAKPVDYKQQLHISGKGLEDVYIWLPVAPAGFVSLGCVATKSQDIPSTDLVCCVLDSLTMQVPVSKKPLWSYIGSRGNDSCSLWRVENQLNTFLAVPNLKRPAGKVAFALAERGKPKLQRNVTADVKISWLAVSILDDLGGMMVPLMDTTITDINLASYGQPEGLDVVAVCSIAASTFNTQFEAWEPLIEPFEGVIKYEYKDVNSETAFKVGRAIRITTASIVNMNMTSAGLEALVGAFLAWQKRSEVEEQAQIAMHMEENDYKDSFTGEHSTALEQDDSEKMVIYNNLHCNLFLRLCNRDDGKVESVSFGNKYSVDIPPLKYPIKFTGPLQRRSPSHFVVVHISEAKDITLSKDTCNQEILCALRLVNTKDTSEDQQKALLQSARSRAVKPCIVGGNEHVFKASAKWNESFIFEVPSEGFSTLEIVVTNISAKGGKGEAVGTLSLPINNEQGQRISSSAHLWKQLVQVITQGSVSSWPTAQTKIVALNSPAKQGMGTEHHSFNRGEMTLRLFHFTMGATRNSTNESRNDESQFKDLAFWFGLTPDGPWEGLRSILSQGVISKVVNGQKIAIEVNVNEGRKHVSFRSLATICNNCDVALEVSVCPVALLNRHDRTPGSSPSEIDLFLEECFENQRYQPLVGWGSKWPGHLLPTDPGRWSTRDFSRFSQEFLDVPLAPGWIWTSDWKVDNSGYVDNEGWFYGPDFQSLRLLPESVKASRKSTFDFARRRRWVRTRQRVPEDKGSRTRKNLGVLHPSCVMSLPLASTAPETDFCVQVRPHIDTSEEAFLWGRAVSDLTSSDSNRPIAGQSSSRSSMQQTKGGVPVSVFMLNQLEKTDALLLCVSANSRARMGHSWLNMEADAKILYTDLNEAIFDWKLSVNTPLKIENLLPCNAEYIVWEKGSNANLVQRQHGIVSAGSTIYVYSVDTRKPIYLTWLAQGGWKPLKEAVVIFDPASDELPLHFWMQHQQSGRRLRVSMEYNYGSTNVAAKIVRLFVPYWICNDAKLPLSFHLVEIEPTAAVAPDSSWLQRAGKATKQSSSLPSYVVERGKKSLRKVIKTLDIIEDSFATPIMLSLHSELERLQNSSQSRADESSFMLRLGLSVAVSNSNIFSHGLCLRDFEDSKDQVDIKAIDSQGAYYRLSAQLDMTSERTKVVHIQPHTVFINRLGKRVQLRQGDCRHEEFLYPSDPPKTILWCTTQEPEVLKISIEGYRWSQPFSVENEGVMQIGLWDELGDSRYIIRVDVRNGMSGSRTLVIFRQVSAHGPYRIENRSALVPCRFRQVDSSSESWQLLKTGSSVSFAWENLQRQRLLEILIEGADHLQSCMYNIDEIGDHQPMPTRSGPVAAIHVTVSREKGIQFIRIADWTPVDSTLAIVPFGLPSVLSPRISEKASPLLQEGSIADDSENQFVTVIELAEFGISVVDHTPEELLYISLQNFVLSYASGLGFQTSRLKIRVDGLQVDNQLPLTPMPVLFTSKDPANEAEFALKLTLTTKNQGMLDQYTYPFIGIQGPSSSNMCFLINIHEPIIWRLHEMFQNLNLNRLTSSQTTAVALDPIIHIGLFSNTEFRFKVTLAMSPTQRPRGVLGFWSTLLTSLGNTDDMQIRITPHLHEEIHMRQTALVAAAIASIRNDILSQPLRLMAGVDLLGNASSALGHMSKGIAALSMDKKFIRSRQKQEIKANVDHLGDGILEGGEALAKSIFRGFTGIVTKPLEGARSSGVEGFIQGVGKGVIGAAVQPVSGILDLLSKTTEGANATRMKISAVLGTAEQLMRRRLPRVISGDNILRPYDEYKAEGLVLLQLAHRAIFSHMDFFKIRGKLAWSDAYEDHFHLPKGRTFIITDRRVILLQHPTGLIIQKKPDLLKDACMILWDVTWNDLLSMELMHGKKDPPHSPPSRLVLNLCHNAQDSKLFDSREYIRIVKCHSGSNQAFEVHSSVQRAYDTYGPNRARAASQEKHRSVTRPYAGVRSSATRKFLIDFTVSKMGPAVTKPQNKPSLDTELNMQSASSPIVLQETDANNQSFENFSFNEEFSSVRGRFISTFQLIWWNKLDAAASQSLPMSIWRPVSPSGYVSVGDVIQASYEPPDTAKVYSDNYEGNFVFPEGFDLVHRQSQSVSSDPLTIWMPRPPPGYVAIGCVAVADFCEPEANVVCCVHHDSVAKATLTQVSLWKGSTPVSRFCRIWKVNNDSRTFLIQGEHEPFPENIAFGIL